VAFFDRLRNSGRVWAPFYTWHKLMAGMLDSYTLMGDRTALGVVEGMAGWTSRWMATLDAAAQQKMLNVEHGGMVATLYELGDATGKTEYYALGDQFRHQRILAPMAAGRDELAGVHGNTTLPNTLVPSTNTVSAPAGLTTMVTGTQRGLFHAVGICTPATTMPL
jgi:hypothetical protein